MNYKAIVAFVIMGGALFQVYNMYVNGFTYNKLIPRDKHGFVIDSKSVKITATQEALKAYKNLLSGESLNKVKQNIALVEQIQNDHMKKLDAIGGKVPSNSDQTGLNDPVKPTGASGEAGLPSLPPVAEEPTGAALPPALPESEDSKEPQSLADSNQAHSDVSGMPELPEVPQLDSSLVEDEGETENIKGVADIESVSEDMNAKIEENQIKNSDLVSDEESPLEPKQKVTKTKKSFDPVKELAKRNLMSCETKNSKGRIPSLIWNYIVKKSDSPEYLSKGNETLPEISKAILKDEACWPKLWSMNPQLENPYDIPSGITIFFLQEDARLPANKKAGD